jgi:hypothetical protein
VKGIQACSNIRPDSLQRGNNHKNVKIGWDLLNIFSSRFQNHWANFNQTWHKSSLGGGIQVCTNEEDLLPFSKEK